MAQTVTLSSAGTAALVLNPVAKSTTVMLSASIASSNTAAQIEMSLDDPTIQGGPTATWALMSSASGMVGSSATSALSVVYTILSPIAQVRINSSATAASSNTWTLKALQSVTA
jgi:hypothetical protein